MLKYGNSGSRNRGKKYKKLKGFEQPTPESEEKARSFMKWYGDNINRLSLRLGINYNDEIATDTALTIYDNISLKKYDIKDYEGYFLRAYATSRLRFISKKNNFINIEDVNLKASEFKPLKYEELSNKITSEILRYVRNNYKPYDVSLFEIYVGLTPDISYDRLATMLGIRRYNVWKAIGTIKKDVAKRFKNYRDILLSADDL